jgi:hypothetical protein
MDFSLANYGNTGGDVMANEYVMEKEQAIYFGRRIYKDIAAYIKANQKEYLEFLSREKKEGAKPNESKIAGRHKKIPR